MEEDESLYTGTKPETDRNPPARVTTRRRRRSVARRHTWMDDICPTIFYQSPNYKIPHRLLSSTLSKSPAMPYHQSIPSNPLTIQRYPAIQSPYLVRLLLHCVHLFPRSAPSRATCPSSSVSRFALVTPDMTLDTATSKSV